jgi:hypothetical protein
MKSEHSKNHAIFRPLLLASYAACFVQITDAIVMHSGPRLTVIFQLFEAGEDISAARSIAVALLVGRGGLEPTTKGL